MKKATLKLLNDFKKTVIVYYFLNLGKDRILVVFSYVNTPNVRKSMMVDNEGGAVISLFFHLLENEQGEQKSD